MDNKELLKLRKSLSLKQLDFCDKLKISQSYLSEMEKGKKPVTEELYNKMVDVFGLDAVLAIKSTERSDKTISIQQSEIKENARKGALIYDIDATCGSSGRDIEFADERVIGSIDAPEINPDSKIIFATGDSMLPLIASGDRIVIRKIESWDYFNYGQVYLIITNEYRFIKRVRRHPKDDENLILLRSENSEFDDIDLPRKEIIHLFIVENILSIKNIL